MQHLPSCSLKFDKSILGSLNYLLIVYTAVLWSLVHGYMRHVQRCLNCANCGKACPVWSFVHRVNLVRSD